MHFKVLFSRQAWKKRHGITKTLLVMKLTSILLLGACLQVSARVHAQTVSFSGNNVPLEKVFAAVEKQTGYVFFFDEAILKDARPVTIRAENYSLPLFLSCVLNGQPFRYSFQNKTIVISRKESVPAPAPSAADTTQPFAPQLVHGLVMDTNGIALSGAYVTVKETGRSTITDAKGVFNIPVPASKATIIASFVGYTTREIQLQAGQQQIFVSLTIAVNMLDEEVVQAYGKTSQRLAVGNIVKVSGEELRKQPVMNPLLALSGRVPGMLVTPTSGYLSAPVKVEIRGRNTINESLVSDPLYVIDGVPLTVLDINASFFTPTSYERGSTGFFQAGLMSYAGGQSPLFSINPADIESITVLKDAAATSIYGARGANGVILITTKKAKPGKTRFEVGLQESIMTAPKQWDMLSTPQYLQIRREALKNDGLAYTVANAPELGWDTTRSVDWQKEILSWSKSTEANIRLSGGDRFTSFVISGGYTQAKELTNFDGKNQRATLSSNLTHKSANQKLTLDLSTTYSYTNTKSIQMPSLTAVLPPNAPTIFDAKGALNYTEWNKVGQGNAFPFYTILRTSGAVTSFINAGVGVSYNVVKGLTLSFKGGYSNGQSNAFWYNPIASQNPLSGILGNTGFGFTTINNWNIDPQINYSFSLGGGRLEIMAGSSYQSSVSKGTTLAGSNYTNDALLQSISSAASVSSGQQEARRRYANVRTRINYNWRNKYILELTGNREGSSNFGPGRQYGNFWSAGGAWLASEESWMKRLLPSWWSFVKLNGSYGLTGTEAGASYQYLSRWTVTNDYAGQQQSYNGVTPMTSAQAVNPDYQWQETRKVNIDLTVGFLKDRIMLTTSWYRNECNNQLTNMPIPAFSGFTTVIGNSPANVRNEGWEGTIHARLVESKTFSWTFGFNIGINKNKLLSYPGFEFSSFYTTKRIGKPLNTKYLFHYLGINPQNGRRSFEDYNHDGLVTAMSGIPPGTLNDDRYVALDPTPKYEGGITNTVTYKRIALTLHCQYKNMLAPRAFAGTAGSMGNTPTEILGKYWRQPGDQTIYPRLTSISSTSESQFAQSDGYYVNASFIRLAAVALAYSLSDAACKRLHMQGATISVNTSNLINITGFKGLDPEVSSLSLPQPRIIAVRVSLNF